MLRGTGTVGQGPFYLYEGFGTIKISSDVWISACIKNAEGQTVTGLSHAAGTETSTHAFNVPASGSYYLNVDQGDNELWEITIESGQ